MVWYTIKLSRTYVSTIAPASTRTTAIMRRVPHFLTTLSKFLLEMPSVIKRLNLYIAVDSGPIYVAHALGVPVIDIDGEIFVGFNRQDLEGALNIK